MNMDARLSTAMAMCQMLLRQKQSERDSRLTGEDIASAVQEIIGMLKYGDIDTQALIKVLEERFTVYAPDHRTLGADDNHIAWLPARRGAMTWRYWDRYRIYLDERMPPSGVASVDRVTDDVLQRLEDPEREGMWDRRGLVMGHVQSGKTANYCGLICKAADAGYKVIVVLSGIHNSLRSQTQIRMDEGFLGFMSEPAAGGNQAFRPAGVGAIDASIVANTATNRTERGDFHRKVASQFGIHPGGIPLLFVTKKVVSVLKNLNNWIASCTNAEEPATRRRFIRDVPVLVIDDEADLASIDTRLQALDENGIPDPEHDPTETNAQIRRLLRAFEKVAYVGYTATPFANIYIYDKGSTTRLGDDLFPRSFIVSIPPPTNYMGPARIFGVAEDEDVGLEEVHALPVIRVVSDHAETQTVDETSGWMPPRLTARTQHDPRYQGSASVPPSLREAMLAFLLATVTRAIRRCQPLHNTMLVHVVRYTAVQKKVADQVESTLKDIVQRLKHGDGNRHPTIIEELKELWARDFETTSSQCGPILKEELPLPPWAEVESRLLPVASSIRVKIINGSAGDVLDYEEHKDTGMNVIAIGGDKLSRGLTLEGLTVSYFLRASRMYDTLMQMGRWFGYRGHYVDLCRLYTTTELLEWFTHITAASEELRQEFDHMVHVGGTPRDYGLKVRSHPTLLVTSAVKMRNGTKLKLSFAGSISETIIFRHDPAWLRANLTATESWLSSLGEPIETGEGDATDWHGVTDAKILDFLSSYSTHPDAHRASAALLAKYIRNQNAIDELKEWTVRLCAGEGPIYDLTAGHLRVRLAKRQRFPSAAAADRYTIRRLVNPSDERVDLSDSEYETAKQLTIDNWKAASQSGPARKEPARAGGREIREVRDKRKGVLLIYALDPMEAGLPKGTPPVVGIALSFPKTPNAREVTYTVNNVFTRQGGDDDSL